MAPPSGSWTISSSAFAFVRRGSRRGWRQHDLARLAGTSDATVSRMERGHVGSMPLETLRRVAAALEIRVELLPRSRAADLDRLVSARHAALAEAVLERFRSLPGWVVRPEVSFNVYGERGVVDLLAWHDRARALLVIELKTEIVDVGGLLGVLDRKRRLGDDIGESLGWRPATVSAWLIVGEGMTNRRRPCRTTGGASEPGSCDPSASCAR